MGEHSVVPIRQTRPNATPCSSTTHLDHKRQSCREDQRNPGCVPVTQTQRCERGGQPGVERELFIETAQSRNTRTDRVRARQRNTAADTRSRHARMGMCASHRRFPNKSADQICDSRTKVLLPAFDSAATNRQNNAKGHEPKLPRSQ
jgi:hypothetical protein